MSAPCSTTTSGAATDSCFRLLDLTRARLSRAASPSSRCCLALLSSHGVSIWSVVHHTGLGEPPRLRLSIGKPSSQYLRNTAACVRNPMAFAMPSSPQYCASAYPSSLTLHRHPCFVYVNPSHARLTKTHRSVTGECRSRSWPQVGQDTRGLGRGRPRSPCRTGERRGFGLPPRCALCIPCWFLIGFALRRARRDGHSYATGAFRVSSGKFGALVSRACNATSGACEIGGVWGVTSSTLVKCLLTRGLANVQS